LSPASLIFLPGTEIHRMAENENLIKDEKEEIYRKSFPMIPDTYLKLLIYFASFSRFPKIILKILSQNLLVNLLEKKMLKNAYFFLWRGIETFGLFVRALLIINRKIRSFTKA
jgi:hypothetical protein